MFQKSQLVVKRMYEITLKKHFVYLSFHFLCLFSNDQGTKLRLKSEIPDSPKLGYEVHQVGILQLLIGAGWEGRERELAQLS